MPLCGSIYPASRYISSAVSEHDRATAPKNARMFRSRISASASAGVTIDVLLSSGESATYSVTAGVSVTQDGAVVSLYSLKPNDKVAMAQSIAQSLSAWDLTVTVEVLPWEEYLAAVQTGDFDLYYGETKLTADWDLTRLLGTGGAMNYGGWSSAVTDGRLTAFRTASNRQQAGTGLYNHLTQEMPLIPLCFKSLSVLTHSGTVEGLHPTQSNVFYALSDWTIHMAS